MQVNQFNDFSKGFVAPSGRLNSTSKRGSKVAPYPAGRKTLAPQFDRQEIKNPKRQRVVKALKPSLKVDPTSGTTKLHTALKEGDRAGALKEIKRWGLLNAREPATLWTPLHCLSCCAWADEEFFELMELLIKGGCSPNARCNRGNTFLDHLGGSWNLDVNNFKELFKLLSNKGFTFYNPHHELANFLLEHAETPGIPAPDRAEIIADYFSYIPKEHRQKAAEELFIKLLKSLEFAEGDAAEMLENLLERLGEDFNPSLACDKDGNNLIYFALLNWSNSPTEMVKIFTIFAKWGIDTENCGHNHSLFENLITCQYSFEKKKEILRKMMDAGITCSLTAQGDEESAMPTPIRLIETLLHYNLKCEEVSEIVKIMLHEDWFREYLLLKLIANCFSTDADYSNEEGKAPLSGCITSMTDFYRWLETESSEFYERIAHSPSQAKVLCHASAEKLSSQTVQLMEAIAEETWAKIFKITGEALGSAFTHRKLRKFKPIKNLVDANGFFAFVPSMSTGEAESRHSIGLIFKPPVVLFCNKGYDLAERSGISRHVLSNKKTKIALKKALQGDDLHRFTREFFHTRIERGKASPFIATQKNQQADNCPVASFGSMELGILITALEEELSGLDKDVAIEIARAIKRAHRQSRRRQLLEEYEAFHQNLDCGIPSYLPSIEILKTKCPEHFSKNTHASVPKKNKQNTKKRKSPE
ncbi:ankyrin repeat domain-containing protein [Estrella lausannensis]|uniref:Uncharacterized protein n=1 Tax=Estrella lausannensis TaxID=483423 RepID=A0A0H5DUE1_9BACT|nr:ankyrin repeat domain-containing protein [Estrella lausannensis]CRX39559.1 hypothetical protein ELAC_2239 [Estrella lausannensis]